ncbi:MAG TPA: cyclic nucleotide-binding domain-containing protein [Anaerolineales bacterium]|nr:cyclic nucleotide-binding domain-containing protein [Anaerolineales bacterium]
MVSPELLRRYPFFAALNDEQLKAIAMIANERTYPKGMLLVKENTPANVLMLLLEGDVDLIYSGGGEGAICNALVGSIAPGEILGVSSLIEPYTFISTARATMPVKVVEIDGNALRALMAVDQKLGYALMCNTAAAVLERLKYTQVELAAARA